MLGSMPYSPTCVPKMSTVSENGTMRERRDRGEHRDRGREREHPADRAVGAELLLEQQLPDVGHRLQRAERADAVGAVAVLEAAEDLALGEQHDRDELEHDREDHQRLEELDPPGLVVADLGEDGHAAPLLVRVAGAAGVRMAPRPASARRGPPTRRTATTARGSTLAGSSCVPSIRKTEPPGIAARSARRRARACRWSRPRPASPSRTPSRSASAGESSTTWRGCMNCSTGERSTSGAAHSERQVPRRRRRRSGRAGERRHVELGGLPRAGAERGRRLGGGPAHAAPADQRRA